MQAFMNKKLLWLLITVLAAAGLAFATRRRPAPSAAAGPATPAAAAIVTVATPRMRDVPDTLSVTGTISAQDELSVGAEVSGLRIVSVDADEGTQVSAGQTLATLDASVLQAQLDQARARLAESQANMGKAVQPNRPQDIAALEHAVLQARANLEQAQDSLRQAEASRHNSETNLLRYKELLNQDYATQQEYDDRATQAERDRAGVRAAEDQVRASQEGVRQAEERLSLARAGGRQEDVQFARASTREAAATVEELNAQMAQTVVRAPDDGLIIKRDAHLGDIVSSGKPLFSMVRKDRLELRAQVPQVDLARVHVGQQVTIKAGTRQVDGRVRLITPSIDPNTRLGTARIAVPTGSGLMPGMFVHAELALGSTRALVVPSDAVLGSAEQPYVFVLQGAQAHRRDVVIGKRFSDTVEVASGLTPQDAVIVQGAAFLTDGDTVRTAPAP